KYAVGQGRGLAQQDGEDTVLERGRIGLGPLLGSARGGGEESEPDGVGSIGERRSIGFCQASLEVEEGRDQRGLGKNAAGRQNKQSDQRQCALHGASPLTARHWPPGGS